ncbi:MAG: beta-galactosidase [Acidobacteriia bacterium]|nr:beta-galactosidase [Terriglobia bacterium]
MARSGVDQGALWAIRASATDALRLNRRAPGKPAGGPALDQGVRPTPFAQQRPLRVLRLPVLLMAFAALAASPAAPPKPDYVQAVEFPYYLYPRALWERELVWFKTIGVRTVEFSIPWNWHQIQPADFDFTGRTSPRRDLVGLIRLLRKLDLHAWVRPLPPVPAWPNNAGPAGGPLDPRAQRAWIRQLDQLLAPQTAGHGGPIAYVEGHALSIDAAAPPSPVTTISANDPDALARSRESLAQGTPSGLGALLWSDVEDSLYPAGWAVDPASFLRKGAVGLSGDEHPTTGALRRDAALLRNWSPLLPGLRSVPLPKPAAGKFPVGVSAFELVSRGASAVSITNRGTKPFSDELRVLEPVSRRVLVIPRVTVQPGDSLWLPLGVSLGTDGLCRECSNFSAAENIVYATAELLSIEFENGILAMEFAAPQPGEVILQLARKPVGPFLAAGRPAEFDWDDKTLRARLPIPDSNAPGSHVRIGIAIEEPETSAFFNDARRLVIGQKNLVSTAYSSEDVANRSRLRLPQGFTATRTVKSPNEMDYEVNVPAGLLHGDWANLALEADGILLGRAHLQLFRPASIRLMEAMQIHFGSQTELTPDPPTAVIEPKAGGNLEISIRNNYPGIQTYHLEASGEGLEFFPPKTEISIGATDERRVSMRVFAAEGISGLRDWHIRVTGGTQVDLPMRLLLLPRGRTVAWTADLDGDGSPEWVLESQKVRAVFSTQDGGRWMEFTGKDLNSNLLPDQGIFATPGPVDVRADGDSLEFSAKGWKRTVRLLEGVVTIEQTSPLPADGLTTDRRGNTTLTIERPSPSRAVYTLK